MKGPVALTVNGNAETDVKNAQNHQALIESKDRYDVIKILRERLATLNQNKGRSAEEFFNEFSAQHGIENN